MQQPTSTRSLRCSRNPIASSHALNHATLPVGLALAGQGFEALAQEPHLRRGLTVDRHAITNRAVTDSLGLPVAAATA